MPRMAPCPSSPNCVSTLSDDEEHSIDPLTFQGSSQEAKDKLLPIIRDMPRTKVVEDDGPYIHAEFRSLIFRFVDDVEFMIDEEAGVIHFRSASRLGYGDMGVNRRRMEDIRRAFEGASGVQ